MDKQRAHGVVVLLARWSRVLGRLTQRARGFLLLCLSRTPLFLCHAAIVAPDTIRAVPVNVAGSRRVAACVELPGSPDRRARGTAVFLVHDSMQQTCPRGLAQRHAARGGLDKPWSGGTTGPSR
eukprot:scaffold45885_cov63-Phaeocystis_antarctica.AAC.2